MRDLVTLQIELEQLCLISILAAPLEFVLVDGLRSDETDFDLSFSEEPAGFFGACSITVEHQSESVDARLFGKADDFFALLFSHAAGHDADGGNVEDDAVVEGFDNHQAVVLEDEGVSGCSQASG